MISYCHEFLESHIFIFVFIFSKFMCCCARLWNSLEVHSAQVQFPVETLQTGEIHVLLLYYALTLILVGLKIDIRPTIQYIWTSFRLEFPINILRSSIMVSFILIFWNQCLYQTSCWIALPDNIHQLWLNKSAFSSLLAVKHVKKFLKAAF